MTFIRSTPTPEDANDFHKFEDAANAFQNEVEKLNDRLKQELISNCNPVLKMQVNALASNQISNGLCELVATTVTELTQAISDEAFTQIEIIGSIFETKWQTILKNENGK